MASNVAAMLSYGLFFVTGIIFLVLEDHREDKFVRFHAFQSIFYSVAYLIYWIVWSRLTWLGLFAPGFISIALYLTGLLVFLGFLGLWLFLMYKAYNNEKYIIPFIGELAAKQAG